MLLAILFPVKYVALVFGVLAERQLNNVHLIAAMDSLTVQMQVSFYYSYAQQRIELQLTCFTRCSLVWQCTTAKKGWVLNYGECGVWSIWPANWC